jgi:uncharacterized protein involved in oxidation of intracellular sulfur
MKTLFIFNEGPYGSERIYNGLRLSGALAKRDGHEVRVFLMGDAVAAARARQKVPPGFYNVEVMLGNVIRAGGDASNCGVCGSCMDARGIAAEDLATGIHRGTLEELANWSEWADKVLVF